MARIPVITSPCPLRWASLPEAGRDHCGQCDRKVHSLDGMSATQREAFLGGCTGKVCIAFTANVRQQRRNVALGAGLLAALAGSSAMAAEPDLGLAATTGPTSPVDTTIAVAGEEPAIEDLEIIMVGGVEDGATARWMDESELDATDSDALPVIGASDWLPSVAE